MRKIPLAILLSLICLSSAQTVKYPLQIGDTDQISEMSWSPNNDLMLTASGDGDALRLWDVASGRLLWKDNLGFLQDDLENSAVNTSDWTQDQKLILTGTRNGKLQLWEAATGKLIWNIKAYTGTYAAISISPDSKAFVATAETKDFKSELKVWNLADGKLIRDLSANQKAVSAIRFIDANHFQTGDGFGQITTWSTKESQAISTKQNSPCGVVD